MGVNGEDEKTDEAECERGCFSDDEDQSIAGIHKKL